MEVAASCVSVDMTGADLRCRVRKRSSSKGLHMPAANLFVVMGSKRQQTPTASSSGPQSKERLLQDANATLESTCDELGE